MSELRSIPYPFKAEHAAMLRKVGYALARTPLQRLKGPSLLVGLLLLDLAAKIDLEFKPKSNVVQFPRGDGPERAA